MRRWKALGCTLAAAGTMLALAGHAAAAGNVVISQVYGGGGNSGAPYTNDYVELFNRGTSSQDLSTWSIQYTSATGTGNFGSAANLLTPLGGVLEPGQHQLVEEASGGTNGIALPTPKTPDATPINMSATGGKVALVSSTTPLGCNGGSTPCPPAALAQIVDLVGYDGANFYEGTAPAPALTNTTAALRGGAGCQDADDNAADFVAGAPDPRTLMSPLVFCTPPTPELAISQVYGGGGNSGATYRNDFVEVFNRGLAAVSLSGWSVQYASASGTGAWAQTPLTDVTLQPGQYYLVQEARGSGGTLDLPPPDATGTTPMSATAGKVALVHSTLPLNGACPSDATIADVIGYGAANCSETSPAPALTNTTAGLRAGDGCVDTGDNSADVSPGAPAPRNTSSSFKDCSADLAPSVASSSPAPGASDVAVDADLSVTFSEPVDVHGSWFSISCGASGAHTAAVSGGPTTFTLDPDTDFGNAETCTVTVFAASVTDQDTHDPPDTMAADASFSFTTTAPPVAIHDIQGAAQTSPFAGQSVSGVRGIVTAKRTNGFYMEDPNPDSDPATSEGIFVFTSSAPAVGVGDAVRVAARVQEFRPGGASSANLTTTELTSPTVSVLSSGNPPPGPTVVGTGGRVPPDTVIENDASSGDVETSGVFDPAQDGLDFWESLEGMRIQLDDPVAVGPTNAFGETQVVGDNGANASVRTARGGLLLRPTDGNPERVVADDALVALPSLNVGDHYTGPLVGVLDYNFGNFFLEVTNAVGAVHDGVTPESTTPAGLNQVAVATFNFENLAPSDPQSKFDRLAAILVDNLKAPDIVSGEEVQDNSGAVDNGVVAADQTLAKLVAAIQAAGGPTYDYREIDPVNDADGGQPGGNIRQVFLFRTDRGVSFVDRPGGDSTKADAVVGSGTDTQLQYSPGRIDPTNGAWTDSRKPLAGEFTFNGHHLFVVANHFNSKGGDQPLLGHLQPPARSSEVQRHQQAQVVHDFVASILAADPNANVVVDGDLNDFEFSDTVSILKQGVLTDLMDGLPLNERYSYVFEGNSQTLDHILLGGALTGRPYVFDPVHVNAEFADQASDHDPSVVRITLNDPPKAAAIGPYAVDEGSSLTLGASATDPEGAALSYAWDLDGNGTFETPGQSVTYAADDGPAHPTVAVQVTDDGGLTDVAHATVDIANVPPTITSLPASPPSTLTGEPVTFTGSASDPSAVDVAAGFDWAVDAGSGYGAFGGNPFAATFGTCGAHTVTAEARDKDGGVSAPFVSPIVQVYDGSVLPPLQSGSYNLVQRGRTVPVKITVGCGGFLAGLQPAISVRAGDYDPSVDPGDPSYVVPDSSSNADTSGVMRESDGQYVYNLAVPSSAASGQLYTVLVRPFGGSSPTLYAVLKIK